MSGGVRSALAAAIASRRQRAVASAADRMHPGDGFLMQRGWTVAWCGWQWDVVPGPGLVGLEAPQALDEDGQPLRGRVAVEFQPNAPVPEKLLANRVHRPYPVADVDDPDAELSVRDWPGGERTTPVAGSAMMARSRVWMLAHEEVSTR